MLSRLKLTARSIISVPDARTRTGGQFLAVRISCSGCDRFSPAPLPANGIKTLILAISSQKIQNKRNEKKQCRPLNAPPTTAPTPVTNRRLHEKQINELQVLRASFHVGTFQIGSQCKVSRHFTRTLP